MPGPFTFPVAKSVPYDNTVSGLPASDVNEAIDKVLENTIVSTSPGFSWGRSGNTTNGTWLLNETVPSNISGRTFPLHNGILYEVSVSNENANTFNIEIYEHDKITYTLLATISLVSETSKTQSFTGINITRGKEIAAKVTGGSCKNVVVQALFKGSTIP